MKTNKQKENPHYVDMKYICSVQDNLLKLGLTMSMTYFLLTNSIGNETKHPSKQILRQKDKTAHEIK